MFRSGYSIGKAIASCALFLLGATGRSASRPDEIPFEKHTIDLGASETAVFADINRDGKLDLVSGEYWYEAPRWIKHRFREIPYTENYVDDLSTLPLDVDGDGYVDLVTSGKNTRSPSVHPSSFLSWSTWIMTARPTRFCRNSETIVRSPGMNATSTAGWWSTLSATTAMVMALEWAT